MDSEALKHEARAYVMPHPPLIVKGVGDGTEIPATRVACERIGQEDSGADVAVIVSPHSVLYADYFHISPGSGAKGSFAQFRAPQVKFDVEYDNELAQWIAEYSEKEAIPAGFLGERDKSLDHGTMVPLYFTRSKRIVRVSLSGLSYIDHYRFGMCIRRAIGSLGRKTTIIASGDMSHKLGGSYGFSQFGVDHDEYVRDCIARSDIRRLFAIDPAVAENAGECGLRSIMIMCGALDGFKVKSEVLSYECPYGVGYLTAKFTADGESESLLPLIISDKDARLSKIRAGEDDFVKLARENVEMYVRTGKPMDAPRNLPSELLQDRSGVFVSIKKNGNLRGCIGTTSPTTANIAHEIIQNGVSACSRDPRFDPITSDELGDLTFSVDVLLPPERITDKFQLDPKRYGVIVTSGHRRGLLLPNLDGVDTVDEQLRIAMQKGGIQPNERCSLERFEVIRHK